MIRRFGFSALLTIASIVFVLFKYDAGAALTIVILIAIELAFSFDNAIINAKVLERLPKIWRQLFLTLGMVIAIVGMRFIFPILIVMVTGHLGWSQVIDDALNHPAVYAEHLEAAHPSISAFGGSFLLVLSLFFLFEARDVHWLEWIERPLQRLNGGLWLPPVLTIIIVMIVSLFAGEHGGTVLRAGLIGAIAYTVIKFAIDGLNKLTGGDKSPAVMYAGWSAFTAFIYLQVLDASFSFDGVLGAFAITDKIILIAIGLGVGAIWVRSLTIFLVEKGTLGTYIYLEHGAHYAILVLAAALLASLFIEVPDAITGIVGIGIILSSFLASREALRARQQEA